MKADYLINAATSAVKDIQPGTVLKCDLVNEVLEDPVSEFVDGVGFVNIVRKEPGSRYFVLARIPDDSEAQEAYNRLIDILKGRQ